jgi:PhzF family phenazine biosynthesis protein
MRIFQVDAFAEDAFTGNPAAVCLLEAPAEAAWMQRVAAEMNLAETAFVEPGAGGYRLRWFTPATEVALCGHATLASAHVLFSTGIAAPGEPIRFDSASGPLIARRAGPAITLDFPARPARQADLPPGLSEALGLAAPVWTGRSTDDFLVVLGSDQEVTGLRPDLAALAEIRVRGTIVTAPSSRPGADFVSRFFAPAVGVPEDPVTGSAHCTLAPYWCQRLGRDSLTGYQASPRGGTVQVRVQGDRVMLAGRAVTVLAGELTAAAGPAGLPTAQQP